MSYYQTVEAIEEGNRGAIPPEPKKARARVSAEGKEAIPGSPVADDPATPEDEARVEE